MLATLSVRHGQFAPGPAADGRITLELLADAFEQVGRTDDTLQAKTNPFEMATFTDEALLAAERTASQRLERVRVPVAGRVHPPRSAATALRGADWIGCTWLVSRRSRSRA